MKNIFKIIFIGFLTTISRIIGQFLIPNGDQSILAPSVFAENGTMSLAFTIYGILAYSLIASLFLLIRKQMNGNKVVQGLKYGVSCSLIWIIYLLEPLPHVAPLDRITYPIIDSLALIIMGLFLGLLFGKTKSDTKKIKQNKIIPFIVITACFIIGRFVQYFIFDIYSSFTSNTLETVCWSVLTGFIIAFVIIWLNQYVQAEKMLIRALVLGGLLFGLDLIFF